MELFVIRHGIAQQLERENEFSDEKRTLTKEGRERLSEEVKGLRKLGVEFDLMLTSPLIRAVETAEIIAAAMGLGKKDVRTTANLAPGAPANVLFAEIKSHAGAESIALVGHQPDLGILASRIIQSEVDAIQLKKGGVCCINLSQTVPTLRGELVWLLTPRQLRLLARV